MRWGRVDDWRGCECGRARSGEEWWPVPSLTVPFFSFSCFSCTLKLALRAGVTYQRLYDVARVNESRPMIRKVNIDNHHTVY